MFLFTSNYRKPRGYRIINILDRLFEIQGSLEPSQHRFLLWHDRSLRQLIPILRLVRRFVAPVRLLENAGISHLPVNRGVPSDSY
jgi:hypothetical protein